MAYSNNDGCYGNLLSQYDWDVRVAEAIEKAESGCNANAKNYNTNGTTDFGLMEDNSIHADMVGGNLDSLFDPAINIDVAYKIYVAAGKSWTPWNTFTSGKYLSYE